MANETLVAALDHLTGDVVKGKTPRKIKTGALALDELLSGGFTLGPNLVFVGGESGCGASGLMFQAALNLASSGTRVLLFALESDERHAAARLVRSATGLDAYGQLDADQRIGFANEASALKELPLELHATDSTTIYMMNDAVKSALEEQPNKLPTVIVDGADYIACCDEAGLAASLKSIAIEWRVPIICSVSSFDRGSFQNKARLCDEAIYLHHGSGNVIMSLEKSRTHACRNAPVIGVYLDAKTLTFEQSIGEKHAE